MGQRCVHYTERDNGTRVLYAPNQWWQLCSKMFYLFLRSIEMFTFSEYVAAEKTAGFRNNFVTRS